MLDEKIQSFPAETQAIGERGIRLSSTIRKFLKRPIRKAGICNNRAKITGVILVQIQRRFLTSNLQNNGPSNQLDRIDVPAHNESWLWQYNRRPPPHRGGGRYQHEIRNVFLARSPSFHPARLEDVNGWLQYAKPRAGSSSEGEDEVYHW